MDPLLAGRRKRGVQKTKHQTKRLVFGHLMRQAHAAFHAGRVFRVRRAGKDFGQHDACIGIEQGRRWAQPSRAWARKFPASMFVRSVRPDAPDFPHGPSTCT